jgi:hypothetical protein
MYTSIRSVPDDIYLIPDIKNGGIVSIAIFIAIYVDPIITQSNINTNQIFSLAIDRYPLLTDTIGKVIYKAIAEKFDKTKENDQVIEYFRTYLAPAIIELRDYHLKKTIGNCNTNSLKTRLTV